jgi:two-component system sensor histidine kinase/response regulator
VSSGEKGGNVNNARILIAEDEIIVAHNLKSRLEGLGYEVPAIAVSGEETVQRAAEVQPDLVLMDVRLQGEMSGIEAAEQIRAAHDIPVVYLTGYADDVTLAQAKITEPFGYVLKPFEMRELRSTIEMALYKYALDLRLRESERRYRQIVETLQEGVWLLDREGNTTYVNPRMAAMLGYTVDEMLGHPLSCFMDEQDTALASRYLGRRAQGVSEQHEFEFRHKDGRRVYTLLETAPLTDEKGNYSGAIAGVIDITEQMRTGQQLRLQAVALEAAANAIVITDAEGTILWANPAFARLTGYDVEQALGQNPRLLKSGFHDEAFYQQMWDTILAGQVWHAEVVNRREDGSLYTEEMTITPIKDTDGKISHFVAIKQDVSERKRAQQELWQAKEAAEAANQAKSTFLSNMSHEFRTPLNAIIGYSEFLHEEAASLDSDDLASDLKRIEKAGRQLLALVSDILDLSRIEAGKMELRLETFDVGQMLSDVARAATPLAAQQDNHLAVECPQPVGRMHADQSKVRQVLMNLLDNAAKFTQHGQITLTTERQAGEDGDWLLFHVADSGIGVPAEHIAGLFEPFTQTNPSLTRGHQGTGLGLALCRRLCTLMEGEISMASEPGRGSVFSVRLPAVSNGSAAEGQDHG